MYSNFTLPSSVSFSSSPKQSSPLRSSPTKSPSSFSKLIRSVSSSSSSKSPPKSPPKSSSTESSLPKSRNRSSTALCSCTHSPPPPLPPEAAVLAASSVTDKNFKEVLLGGLLDQQQSLTTSDVYFEESLSSSGYSSGDHLSTSQQLSPTSTSCSSYSRQLSPLSVSPQPSLSSSVAVEVLPALPDLTPLLSSLRSVSFDFRLTIDRVRVSWKEADWHKLDQYQLKAYLLLDEDEDQGEVIMTGEDGKTSVPPSPLPLEAISEDPAGPSNSTAKDTNVQGKKNTSSNSSQAAATKKNSRKKGFPFKKLLATIAATRSLTLTTGDTEICFDDAAIAFRTAIPVEANEKGGKGGESSASKKSPAKQEKEKEKEGRPRRQFVFRSRVVRLKLERVRHGAVGSHHLMGFVDVDLAQLRQNCLKASAGEEGNGSSPLQNSYISLPLVFFTDYSRHIGRHQHHLISRFTGAPRFSFDLRLKLDSTPLESHFDQPKKALGGFTLPPSIPLSPPNLDDLDLWISAESLITGLQTDLQDHRGNGALEGSSSSSSSSGSSSLISRYCSSSSSSSSNSSSQSLYLSQLLLRRDSLPNQSDDRELKYHDTPSISRTAHLLNLLGMLPPGQLFRVSIHFGQLEQLDELLQLTTEQGSQQAGSTSMNACLPKKPTSAAASVYASFEVKHQKHQPTIFYAHHQRSSICCRTRPLTSDDFIASGGGSRGSSSGSEPPSSFDQHFTFFERFHVRDSPPTVLAVRHGSSGRKLFAYRCHLADYITARSVNQFFCLTSERALYKASASGSAASMMTTNSSTVCRLQFSIAVKPVTSASYSTSVISKAETGAFAAAVDD